MSASRSRESRDKNPEAYAAEVLQCIRQMQEQKRKLEDDIRHNDSEKRKLQNDIRFLTDKLAKVNHQQAQKTHLKMELEKTIISTENAYAKLLESSQVLYKETKNQMMKAGTSSKLDFTPDKWTNDYRNDGHTIAATVAAECSSPKKCTGQ